MKTPLGRVLGLGSARRGTETFWRQRLTSLALLPLTIFLIVLAITLIGDDYAAVAATLAQPMIAVPVLLFVGLACWHMKIGMQEVVEDYFHGPLRLFLTLGNIFFCAAVAIVAGFALLKLSLGA